MRAQSKDQELRPAIGAAQQEQAKMAKAKITAGSKPSSPRMKQKSGTKSAGGHPQHDLDTGIERAPVALSMRIPGTRLDMALGGSHPLLLEIVHALARQAAQAQHAATAAHASMPTHAATNKKDV